MNSAVLQTHSQEASFLWQLRASSFSSGKYTLADLAKLDERIEAHLDGLRISGGAGWEICREALSTKGTGEVFAAAVLAFENNDRDRIETVIQAGIASPELTEGLIAALGWIHSQQAQPHVERLLASGSPQLCRIGIAVATMRRQDPGPSLLDAIGSDAILLRAAALRAIGEIGLIAYLGETSKDQADASCRFWAAWSAMLGGSRPFGLLRQLAEAGGVHYQESGDVAARRMPRHDAIMWHRALAQRKEQVRTAIRVAQGLADPELIPWLIELMRDPVHARAAGEAFSLITGTDIAYLDLDLKEPPVPASDEPPADATEPPDEDQDLPWPDPRKIAAWWSKYRGNFQAGTRYILGRPIDYESATHALKFGYQRQRAAAAMERVFLHPGEPLFDVAAPGFRQMRQLGLTRKDFRRGRPEW